MKSKILILLVSLLIVFTLNSCITTTTSTDDIYVETEANIVESNVSYNVIIKYGDPFYYNGKLLYYYYNNLYYYPFIYNDYLYMRAYRKPYMYIHNRKHFRPKHRYDRKVNIYRHIDKNRHNRPYDKHNQDQINRQHTNPHFGGKR